MQPLAVADYAPNDTARFCNFYFGTSDSLGLRLRRLEMNSRIFEWSLWLALSVTIGAWSYLLMMLSVAITMPTWV